MVRRRCNTLVSRTEYWVRRQSYVYGMRTPMDNQYNGTYKLMRKVVYGTWLLIEPCGAYRLSVGVSPLFSIIVFFLSIVLFTHHIFSAVIFLTTFISTGIMFTFCDDDGISAFHNSEYRKTKELWTICKCQLVFHADIHFLFFFFLGQNQSFSGSCGSLLVVFL